MRLTLSLQRKAYTSSHLYLLRNNFRICLFSISQACKAATTWIWHSGSRISPLKQSLVPRPDCAWQSCDCVLQCNTVEQNLHSMCLDLCCKKKKKIYLHFFFGSTEIICFMEEHQLIVTDAWNPAIIPVAYIGYKRQQWAAVTTRTGFVVPSCPL